MIKNKEKKEIIKLAEKLYGNFRFLNNITWKPYLAELYEMNLKDEKKHRSASLDREWETSKNDCALVFTVQHICQSLLDENKYTLKDLLHLRASCLYAQSIALNFKDEILKNADLEDIKKFARIDHMIFYNYEDWKTTKGQILRNAG